MKTLILLLMIVPSFAMAANCTYDLDAKSIKVEWTAFKTTAKAPVGGSFTETKVNSKISTQKEVSKILKGLDATISLKDVKALTTGNPVRDQTLFDHFFSKFKDGAINGKFKNVKGSNTDGSFELAIKMNGKTVSIPMQYTLAKDGKFEAKGGLDILDFALQAPFDELHKNCEVLHKGADGVSKTWSTVDLKLEANIGSVCKE